MEIFLSHSKKDVAFCEQLANDLKAAGVKVWYAGWDLEVGDSLTEKLAKEITSKGYFGIVLSPDSVSSAWVRFELRTALANEIKGGTVKVLPLIHRECEIPDALVDMVYLDFRTDYGAALRRLLKRLGVDTDAAQAAELAFNKRHLGEIQSAVGLSGSERPEEALKLLKRAHHRMPDDPIPAMLAALNYQTIGNRSKALEWATKAVASLDHPFQYPVFRSAAEVALWANNFHKARDFLFEGIECAPDEPELREMLADVLLKLEEPAEAYRQAERAVGLRNTATAHVMLGRALGKMEKLEEALGAFQAAVEIDQNDAAAHYFAGVMLGGLRRFAEAETELRRCIELNARPEGYRVLAKTLYELGRYEDEIEALERLTELLPNNAQDLLALGLAYEQVFEFRRAGEKLEASLHINQGAPETLFALARIHLLRDDLKAREYARQYLATGPQGPDREVAQAVFDTAQARILEGRAATGTDEEWSWRPTDENMDELGEKWNPSEERQFIDRLDARDANS